jgi:hypothetical protein
MRVYKRGKRVDKIREVLIVIWEVSTASRKYARMGWDDGEDDDDDDDASGVTTSSKLL